MNMFFILLLGVLGGIVGSLSIMSVFFIWLKKQSKKFGNLEFDHVDLKDGIEKLRENFSSVGKFSNEQLTSMMNELKKQIPKKKELKENEKEEMKSVKNVDEGEKEEI